MVAIVRGTRPRPCPDIISPETRTALDRCWATHPDERPSAQALSVLFNVLSGLRQENRPPLSPQQANAVLDVVDGQVVAGDSHGHNGGNHNGNSTRLVTAPYPCHWPHCDARFHRLVECQTHQVSHVLSMNVAA
jgi:hypothetical protein